MKVDTYKFFANVCDEVIKDHGTKKGFELIDAAFWATDALGTGDIIDLSEIDDRIAEQLVYITAVAASVGDGIFTTWFTFEDYYKKWLDQRGLKHNINSVIENEEVE